MLGSGREWLVAASGADVCTHTSHVLVGYGEGDRNLEWNGCAWARTEDAGVLLERPAKLGGAEPTVDAEGERNPSPDVESPPSQDWPARAFLGERPGRTSRSADAGVSDSIRTTGARSSAQHARLLSSRQHRNRVYAASERAPNNAPVDRQA
jgi:hypothetical protein